MLFEEYITKIQVEYNNLWFNYGLNDFMNILEKNK